MRQFVPLLLLLALPARADAPAPEHSAAAILGEMLRDNARFVATRDEHYFQSFRDEQRPRATVVACADSRVHTHAIEEQPDGDLFVVRNIGNQVDLSGGSVEYGVRHLHTPLLLILGHVHCGAIKAAMGDYTDEPPAIRRELGGLMLSITKTSATGTVEQRWLTNVIGNVHEQVAQALQQYADDVHSGKLDVVGAVYDFRNDLGQGTGRLVIVNVNGEKDPAKIAASRLMKSAQKAR